MKQNKLSFESENLLVDWIGFNIQEFFERKQVKQIAKYLFKNFGFNSTFALWSDGKEEILFYDSKYHFKIIFVKYKYNYLFGKDKPIDEKYLIKMINKDLKHTSKINQIPYNIKSHSFRINMITRLLQKTTVHDAADIIGHKDIKSTMAYKRYALNKKEIQNLLNKIDQKD